ncbi:MAG TPA: hypothetical protein VGL38_07630 [bacterium]|jgi:predicted amidophosphoribosyltransferase
METNITGLILGILLIALLAVLVTLVGAYISLMMKSACPHCRTLMPRKAALCPHCGKAALQTT